jgi:hypothetical protein
MRVGQLFTVSMLSVAGLACVLGGEIVVSEYRAYASKTEAIRSVDAFGAVLLTGQAIAGFRTPYATTLFQESVATRSDRQIRAAGRCGLCESPQRDRGDLR